MFLTSLGTSLQSPQEINHPEMDTQLTQELKRYARELDLDFLGCCPVERLSRAPEETRPTRYLATAKSVISIGYRLGHASLQGLPGTRTAYMLEHDAANRRLDDASHRIVRFLEAQGFATVGFDAGAGFYREAGKTPKRLAADFSHKHTAAACGLGLFGLNNLILSPTCGPRFRLVSVLTDAELDYDDPLGENPCPAGDCKACVQACPVGALDGWEGSYDPARGWVIDKKACYNYIFGTLKGRRCGMCIQACPVGTRE